VHAHQIRVTNDLKVQVGEDGRRLLWVASLTFEHVGKYGTSGGEDRGGDNAGHDGMAAYSVQPTQPPTPYS
jgi:hypothetical protein